MTTFCTKLIIDFGHHYRISGNLDDSFLKTKKKNKKSHVTWNCPQCSSCAGLCKQALDVGKVPHKCLYRVLNGVPVVMVPRSDTCWCNWIQELFYFLKNKFFRYFFFLIWRVGRVCAAVKCVFVFGKAQTLAMRESSVLKMLQRQGGGALPAGSFHRITSFHVVPPLHEHSPPLFSEFSVCLDVFNFVLLSVGFLPLLFVHPHWTVLISLHCRPLMLYLRHRSYESWCCILVFFFFFNKFEIQLCFPHTAAFIWSF